MPQQQYKNCERALSCKRQREMTWWNDSSRAVNMETDTQKLEKRRGKITRFAKGKSQKTIKKGF
jgi:hypothetical protein